MQCTLPFHTGSALPAVLMQSSFLARGLAYATHVCCTQLSSYALAGVTYYAMINDAGDETTVPLSQPGNCSEASRSPT